jgi:thiamine-monophosphate kinase
MDEFTLIRTYFAPLAAGFRGSLNLTDDAAVLDIPAGNQLIATTDTIVEGVHFIGSEDPSMIAKKLLRVNLSDLAAMGATPYAYLLAGTLPKKVNVNWVKKFAKGLSEDQKLFGIALAGGDTTASFGPLTLTITALGLIPKCKALRRNGAKAGDDIYVSGTIGDSALGLLCLKKKLPRDRYLQLRYLLPQPRVALGEKLRGVANACIDISDGLMQDLGHICHTSKTCARLDRPMIPLSPPARKLIEKKSALWNAILSGGDDYELLFTAPKDKASAVAAISRNLKIPTTRIGSITTGKNIVVEDGGKIVTPAKTGYKHF